MVARTILALNAVTPERVLAAIQRGLLQLD
jgi:hypothetical protein